MSEPSAQPAADGSPWTCPFCPLACDHVHAAVAPGEPALRLSGDECVRASAALAAFPALPPEPCASIDLEPCPLDDAVASAAAILGSSRQPLFAGLGTDVAGARALYPLACATGAICEPSGADALMQGLRALQDRGQYTTTLAEVRTRADLIVFVGGIPIDAAPLIGRRCGIGDPQVARRRVVVLGPGEGDDAVLSAWAREAGIEVGGVSLQGDLFETLALLCAAAADRPLMEVAPALRELAASLRKARYAVLVGAPALLPAHGALLIEAVHRLVGTLNRSTRAAALWIGGGQGAATVNQVYTWLSGLPLRSRLGPHGLEHEPLVFDAARLLDGGEVDAVMWISSFDATVLPPAHRLPMIALGPPAMAAGLTRRDAPTVFIAVSTPGIGCDGHLFRTDGTVLMPLHAARPDVLPTVADVAGRIGVALGGTAASGPAAASGERAPAVRPGSGEAR